MMPGLSVSTMRGLTIAVLVCAGMPAASAATFNVLYNFAGGSSDGMEPLGGLTDVGNTLYGMTSDGGANGLGTIFAYNLSTGTEGLLHSFAGAPDDGQVPYGSFAQSAENPTLLYGQTGGGGSAGAGTIFSLDTTTGAETVIYSLGTFVGSGGGGGGPPSRIGEHDLRHGGQHLQLQSDHGRGNTITFAGGQHRLE
jgi:uncharacterized repeat protein (TIGR03803 family)